jgi:hypothetical protein
MSKNLEQLRRLKELFPSNYEKFEQQYPKEFNELITQEITDNSLEKLFHNDKFVNRDEDYWTYLETYIIIKCNLNGRYFYTMDRFSRDRDESELSDYKTYLGKTEILLWKNPGDMFELLYWTNFCPIKNYILDGSLAHQSDLEIIFNTIKSREKKIK